MHEITVNTQATYWDITCDGFVLRVYNNTTADLISSEIVTISRFTKAV